MAAKRKHHSRPKMTISLAVIGGLAPTAYSTYYGYKSDGARGAMGNLGMRLTGYDFRDGKFKLQELWNGVGPLLLGGLVHKMANQMGLNRMISKAGIPVFRI